MNHYFSNIREILKFILVAFVVMTPSLAWANLSAIERAIVTREYEKVRIMSRQALALQTLKEPIRDQILYYLGLSHIYLNDFSSARDVFQQLIDREPEERIYDQAYLGLFDAYYLDGYYEPALLTIERMFRLRKASSFMSLMHLKAARVNLKLAQWTKSKQHLRSILSEFPESFEAHTARQLLDEKQYFAVQVGAFLSQDRAEELLHELQGKNEYAYIVETTDRYDRRFFRVRVGQLSRLGEAESLKLKLSRHGYPAQIVP